MIFKRGLIYKIFIISFLIMSLAFSLLLASCNKIETPTQEIAVKESEEESETAEEEENEITAEEITGNINILSGLEISDTVSDGRPVAVMVENTPDARPQSGLIYADIVFEVVDEYGITRFIAVYSSYDADIVGPVRSARIYYAEIARNLDPLYAFWGTYPDAYAVIEKLGLDYLSPLGDEQGGSSITANISSSSGWREPSRSDILEHTAFMSTVALKEDAAVNGYSLESGQSPLKFKEDAAETDRGDVSGITVDFSDKKTYEAYFEYDNDNNNYLKFVGDSPHNDYETGEQITVNNVIVMITNIEGPIDQYGHMVVRTTGASDIGKAFFFMDGNVVKGTWERSSAFDPFVYRNNNGDIMLFNRGSTWVAMIQDTGRLTY